MKNSSFKSIVLSNLHQIPGWKTNRKIIVFESDDWGSIRMPSTYTYNKLTQRGFKLDTAYNKFDSLETVTDLTLLFDVLSSFKDSNGHHPSITANFLVANPDFEKIKANDFSLYYYEVFTDTYKRYKACEKSFSLIQQGFIENVFKPQFHGREHLNVNLWMKYLQKHPSDLMFAFGHSFWGLERSYFHSNRKNFLSAYDFQDFIELSEINEIITDGLKIFNSIFGYKSKSFIATNYTWHPAIEKTLFQNDVHYIQGSRKQLIPVEGNSSLLRKGRFTGQRNALGQINLVRNVNFEPSRNQSFDWIGNCLKEISRAFYWRKPAIVSSHRVNFSGNISQRNRNTNLSLFRCLLYDILKHWKNVEFMTSDELGYFIEYNNED